MDASKLSIHGTLKRDYLLVSNLFNKEEGKEFRNRLESRFALQRSYKISHALQRDVVESVNALFEGEPSLRLEKDHVYDIPMFHGEGLDNDKHFYRSSEEEYDWSRVNKELLFREEEEEMPRVAERSFIHPATKLVHPVPFEWEEDIMMEKEERKRQRQRQMELESEIVLSAVQTQE